VNEPRKDKGCIVLELRCECGRRFYLAASTQAPCLLALGASPAAAAAALAGKATSQEDRDED
jgi:hypothetical protein